MAVRLCCGRRAKRKPVPHRAEEDLGLDVLVAGRLLGEVKMEALADKVECHRRLGRTRHRLGCPSALEPLRADLVARDAAVRPSDVPTTAMSIRSDIVPVAEVCVEERSRERRVRAPNQLLL